MALIKFKVDTTGPGAPQVDTDGVLNLHPGDRLLFVTNPPGQDVLVDLGDEVTGTLVALVKFKGLPDFEVGQVTDAGGGVHYTVKLLPGGGSDAPPDPPD